MYTEEQLDKLRETVKKELSAKRFSHVIGVEERTIEITSYFALEQVNTMRAAALLHDITKEYNIEKQLLICDKFGIMDRINSNIVPEVIHQVTAPEVIKEQYIEFASDIVLNSVKFHTTGCANYDMFGKILYISDYTEKTRHYDSCVSVRDFFNLEIKNCSTYEQKINILNKACLLRLDYLFNYNVKFGKVIDVESCLFRNKLIDSIL